MMMAMNEVVTQGQVLTSSGRAVTPTWTTGWIVTGAPPKPAADMTFDDVLEAVGVLQRQLGPKWGAVLDRALAYLTPLSDPVRGPELQTRVMTAVMEVGARFSRNRTARFSRNRTAQEVIGDVLTEVAQVFQAVRTVEQARKDRVCRVCGGKDDGPLTLNYGEEYAHTACLNPPLPAAYAGQSVVCEDPPDSPQETSPPLVDDGLIHLREGGCGKPDPYRTTAVRSNATCPACRGK